MAPKKKGKKKNDDDDFAMKEADVAVPAPADDSSSDDSPPPPKKGAARGFAAMANDSDEEEEDKEEQEEEEQAFDFGGKKKKKDKKDAGKKEAPPADDDVDFGKKKKGKKAEATPEESPEESPEDEPADFGAKKKKKDKESPNGKEAAPNGKKAADKAEDKFEPPSRAGSGPVVAKVVQVEKIPKKDKLRILKLKFAEEGPLAKVVTNAPNVQQGDLVAYAPPGSQLPGAKEPVKAAKVGGQESAGMICGPDELGWTGGTPRCSLRRQAERRRKRLRTHPRPQPPTRRRTTSTPSWRSSTRCRREVLGPRRKERRARRLLPRRKMTMTSMRRWPRPEERMHRRNRRKLSRIGSGRMRIR